MCTSSYLSWSSSFSVYFCFLVRVVKYNHPNEIYHLPYITIFFSPCSVSISLRLPSIVAASCIFYCTFLPQFNISEHMTWLFWWANNNNNTDIWSLVLAWQDTRGRNTHCAHPYGWDDATWFPLAWLLFLISSEPKKKLTDTILNMTVLYLLFTLHISNLLTYSEPYHQENRHEKIPTSELYAHLHSRKRTQRVSSYSTNHMWDFLGFESNCRWR